MKYWVAAVRTTAGINKIWQGTNNMKKRIALAIVAALGITGAAYATPLPNMSFETGTGSWAASGPGSDSAGTSFTKFGTTVNVPPSTYGNPGAQFVELFSKGTGLFTSDTFSITNLASTTIGAGYTLWYRALTQDTLSLTNLAGDSAWVQEYVQGNNGTWSWKTIAAWESALGSTSWQHVALDSGAKGIRISMNGDGDNRKSYFFADISPVPEPGEWAMILAGLGLVGMMSRRRSLKG